MQSNRPSNRHTKFTKGAIGPQLRKHASLIIQRDFLFGSYQLIDYFFLGKISTEAVSAVTYIGLIVNFGGTFGLALTAASGSLISNAIGSQNAERTKTFITQSLTITILCGIIVSVLLLLLSPIALRLLDADTAVIALAQSYLLPIALFQIVVFLNSQLILILAAHGYTNPGRNIMVIICVLNLILNPLFAFGGAGIPAMGIVGIALASCVALLIGAVYLVSQTIKHGIISKDDVPYFLPDRQFIVEILNISSPIFFSSLSIRCSDMIFLFFIGSFGVAATAAYGIASGISHLFGLPSKGIAITSSYFVGQNFGAGHLQRVLTTWKLSLSYACLYTIPLSMLLYFFGDSVMSVFSNDDTVISIGLVYFKIISFVILLGAICKVCNNTLLGLGKTTIIARLDLVRLVILPLLFIPILAEAYGLEGIWWAHAVSHVLITLLSLYWIYFAIRKYM